MVAVDTSESELKSCDSNKDFSKGISTEFGLEISGQHKASPVWALVYFLTDRKDQAPRSPGIFSSLMGRGMSSPSGIFTFALSGT